MALELESRAVAVADSVLSHHITVCCVLNVFVGGHYFITTSNAAKGIGVILHSEMRMMQPWRLNLIIHFQA